MKRTENQSTEEALRQSEERYKAFISQSTEGIWRFELEKPISVKWPIKKQLNYVFTYGYLAECNNAMAKMYGYTKAEELVGARLSDLMIPSDPANIDYLTEFIKANYKLSATESHEVDKYGKPHIFENNLVGIIENGKINRAWGTQRDITEQKKSEERRAFLEKVSNKLVVSLNHQVTLQEIAQLVVPYLADYCRIAMVDADQNIKEITVNHKDPKKVTLAKALYENYKDAPDSTYGIPTILKKGKPEIIEILDDSVLKKYNTSESVLKIVKQIGLKSYMGVPLTARGKILGAMTFSSVQDNRYYTKDDLLFVEELAKRIALTLDNIQLFKEAQDELTKREKISEILSLQQERLNLAQEAANIGVFEVDLQSQHVLWSKQLEKLYGLKDGEFKGTSKHWLTLIHPEDRDIVDKGFYEQIKNNAFTEFEFRIIPPDGAIRWIYAKAQVFFDKSYKPIRVVGINIDVTDRKQAILNSYFLAEASKILSSSLNYETTLQNVAKLAVQQIADWCLIGILNKDNIYEQIAVSHKDPNKVKWAMAVGKEYPPNMNTNSGIAKILQTGKAELYPMITDEMIQMTARDKKHLKLLKQLGMTSVMMVPLHAQQKPVGVITFITSETKRRFTNDDVAFAKELAHRASIAIDNAMLYKNAQDAITLRDDFISVASHELKTPVTSVKIFTQVMQKYARMNGDEKAVQNLDKMDKQINKLTDLIYNLLDISKIQTGRLEYAMRDFSIDNMLEEVTETMQHMSSKHQLELKGKADCMVHGDGDRISQVVSNLISNAIKYSPTADKVNIKVSADKKEVHVAVEDFGIGMSKEHFKKVFDRFYRVSGTTDKTFPGLGIGLYISHEIINRHSGKLWVESKAGKGSTFHFTLPIHP
jgi:PAS domain S-box-containing protein